MNIKTTELSELQKKYLMQKPTPENLLKDVILFERGNSTSKSLSAFQPHIKAEPTFAIEGRGRGKFKSNRRGSSTSTNSRDIGFGENRRGRS